VKFKLVEIWEKRLSYITQKTRLLFERVIPKRENWWREADGVNGCQIKRRDQRGEGVTVLPRVIVV